MSRFFVALVSHCEKVWWDPGYDGLQVAVQAMLALQERVGQYLGRSVTSTFCSFVDHPTPTTVEAVAAQIPEVFREVLGSGNEIGLHVHAPTEELRSGLQDLLIAPDAELLMSLGFPQPVTYAAGDFVTSSQTVVCLERAGFQVDCSVYALEGAINRFGVCLDYGRRQDLLAYRPSHHDLCADGDSSIVELPVSGHLPEFAEQEFERLLSIDKRIQTRYARLHEGVDIFQIYWHPFEVVTLDGKDNHALLASGLGSEAGRGKIGVNRRVLHALERFLTDFGQRPDVEIASAIRAVDCWESYDNNG